MGYEWLNEAQQALTQAGFRVERGYPAHTGVCITSAVAALNLTGMDMAQNVATVTATILAPGKEGLDHCQQLAHQAAQVLSGLAGAWSFSGWKFDSSIGCFLIEVVGKVSLSSGGEPVITQLGYEIWIGEEIQTNVTDFLACQQMDRRLIRPHGHSSPIGVTPGMGGWTIRLTQIIPAGTAEPENGAEPFTLTVRREGQTVVYTDCCWSEYSSQQLEAGTKVIRSGFALAREVKADDV